MAKKEKGEERQRPRGDGPAIRVLVVDDDRVDRMAVSRALDRTGWTVTVEEAEGVMSAIELLSRESFDCVLLDYHLPDGDGLTFLRGLRVARIEIPVIMLTGQADEEVARELVRSGAADYVAKSSLTGERLARSLQLALRPE